MGLDLTIYELKNYTMDPDVKTKEYKLEEVAYFSNGTAMLLAEWLYRNYTTEITNRHHEAHHYVEIFEDDLNDILCNLAHVLTCHKKDRAILALYYFPTKYTIGDWINSTAMFSDDYFFRLEELYDKLYPLVNYEEEKEYGRCFFYNISW